MARGDHRAGKMSLQPKSTVRVFITLDIADLSSQQFLLSIRKVAGQ
jgi:hypothetical protein